MSVRPVSLAMLAASLCLLGSSCGWAAPAPATARPTLFPGGGVLSPGGKVAYVPNKSKGIDALRLDSGEVLWSAKQAGHPLLATEDRLFAWGGQGNEITVFVFDTANKGKRLLESKPVKFPDWVVSSGAQGRSFACTAGLDKDNLFLVWQARAWYAGGAAPPPEIMKAANKSADGVARISLENGSVEMMDHAKAKKAGAALPDKISGEVRELKQGEHTFFIEDEAINPRGFLRQVKRLLKAKDSSGKVVWEHEIKAPVQMIPVP